MSSPAISFAKSFLSGPFIEQVLTGISRKIYEKQVDFNFTAVFVIDLTGLVSVVNYNTLQVHESFDFSDSIVDASKDIPASVKFAAKIAGVHLDKESMKEHAMAFVGMMFKGNGLFTHILVNPASKNWKPVSATFRQCVFLPGEKIRVGAFIETTF